jgi:hypothetical protein
VLVIGLNSRWQVADSRVEQSPEGEGVRGPVSEAARLQVAYGQLPPVSAGVRRLRSAVPRGGAHGGRFRPFAVRVRRCSGSSERQEGKGAGDGVRLHGRSKALKGATP